MTLTYKEACCFLGEGSLNSQLVGLTVVVIFFRVRDSYCNNTVVEGDKVKVFCSELRHLSPSIIITAWLCCQGQMLFCRQKCDEESVGQTG